jgi:hypothetical protein
MARMKGAEYDCVSKAQESNLMSFVATAEELGSAFQDF